MRSHIRKACLRVASRRVVAATLQGNRTRLLEMDVRLATQFRDSVVDSIVAQIKDIDPGAPYAPSVFYDGDRSLDIQVENWSTVHPAFSLQVKIPADVFYQFAFGTKKIEVHDALANKSISFPDISGKGRAGDVARDIINALADYVKSGGSPQAKHSGLPMPLTK